MTSRAGYWLGGGLIAVGVLGAVLWLVGSLLRLSDEVDGFPRVAVPGEATVQLEARKYVVYYESSTAEEIVPAVAIQITDARDGTPLEVARYSGSLTYSFFGDEGRAQATVTPEHAGAFVVRTDSAAPTSDANVALGRSIASPIVRAILGTFAIGLLFVGAGVALIVVTAVRRSRARRARVDSGAEAGFSRPDQPGRHMSTSGNTGPPGEPRGIGFGILLYIVTIGIYGIYWSYKTHEEMKQHTGEGLGGVVGLVIWLVINPVSAFVIPSEIGKMYQRDGQEAPMTGWTGLWLFPGVLLIIPAIVWFVKVQGALNRYWEGKLRHVEAPASAASPS